MIEVVINYPFMEWDKDVKNQFEQIMAKVPVFMRPIAHAKVSQTAEMLAQQRQQTTVLQKDMVDAFFKETPFGFHGPMRTDMQSVGINIAQYGY